MTTNLPPIIYASASVKSVGGVSLFDENVEITVDNVEQFDAKPELLNDTVFRLRRAGFHVSSADRQGIRISAPTKVYEQVFKVKIVPINKKANSSNKLTIGLTCEGDDRLGFIDPTQSDFADVLEGVTLPQPVDYCTSPDISPSVSKSKKWHLQLSEIPKKLELTQVHKAKIDGGYIGDKDKPPVKIVVIDSGWYDHPYFETISVTPCIYQHKSELPEIKLASTGDWCFHRYTRKSDKWWDDDRDGHGTMVVANLLPVAPKAEVIMLKAFGGNAADIEIAIKDLKPDIISLSTSLPENIGNEGYIRKIAKIIADANKQGIIVVVAAGNQGSEGVESQMPDVISVGGAYYDKKRQLRASDIANGFEGKFQGKTRNVPDVAGLCGPGPKGDYIAQPVTPESDRDTPGVPDGWTFRTATSQATPQVAGVCALIKQVYPKATTTQVKNILQETATNVTKGRSANGNEAKKHRPDLATGAGLVNGGKAVKLAKKESSKAIGKNLSYLSLLLNKFRKKEK